MRVSGVRVAVGLVITKFKFQITNKKYHKSIYCSVGRTPISPGFLIVCTNAFVKSFKGTKKDY